MVDVFWLSVYILIAGELTSDRLYSSLRRTFGRHDNRKIIFVLNLVAGLSLIQTICRLFQNIFSGFPFNIPLLASLQEWLFPEDVLSSAFVTASLILIQNPPEGVVIPNTKFFKGISPFLKQDFYLGANKENLLVFVDRTRSTQYV